MKKDSEKPKEEAEEEDKEKEEEKTVEDTTTGNIHVIMVQGDEDSRKG